MQLYTSVLGSNGDLYVGGTFESRVWTGSHFADVYHAARFDGAINRDPLGWRLQFVCLHCFSDVYLAARTTTWLPLVDGELLCVDGSTAR
jgi:hypothetical protein